MVATDPHSSSTGQCRLQEWRQRWRGSDPSHYCKATVYHPNPSAHVLAVNTCVDPHYLLLFSILGFGQV
jgi:hypothetical protein